MPLSRQNFYESFLETMTEVLPLLGVALFSGSVEGRRFYNDKIVPLFDRYEANVDASLSAVPGKGVSPAFLARAVIGIIFLLTLDATYRETPTALGQADHSGTAEEVRSFVANALSGPTADELLAQLSDIEATRLPSIEGPPRKPPFVADTAWTSYWSARGGADAHAEKRLSDLTAENQTLRRIVADQAIELRQVRDDRQSSR